MNLIHSDAPEVWILIFDRQLPDCEFDRLDVQSTCFEQFLLQDVRSDINAGEVFGGEPAFSRLANAMTLLGQNASLVNIVMTEATNSAAKAHNERQDMESSMRRSRMPLLDVCELDHRIFCDSENDSRESATVDKAFSANLVWIEANVAAATHPATAATAILDFVCDRLAACSESQQKCPVLLVTFRKGDDFIVREPLKSSVPENPMHVPLWIRPNLGHACRVQALTGSFDLLPTIATFLGNSGATDENSPPDVAQIADLSDLEVASTILTSEPRSLAFLCGAPQVCTNRVLKLHGDGWTGMRTEEFLLVISDNSESDTSQNENESDGDGPEEPSRRLYVKPDDRFNVNDVSSTYATVTEELSCLLHNPDKQAC